MNGEETISYHFERAKAELDRARSAGDATAAQAHFGLAALHMERVRALGEKSGASLALM